MATDTLTFARWLQDSAVPEATLTVPQRGVLLAAFGFLQQRGRDYFSRRLLSHFLLHASTGLKVAPLARLLGFSRSAASAQQGLSSKEVVQAVHHRLAGPSHGKLLPRFACPIAHFLCPQPQATRRARGCFAHDCGSLQRGLLTSAFARVIGLARLFPLEEMADRGFAVLSGGRTCPTRPFVGGWRRHLRWQEVEAFCRRTCPWELIRGDDALISFDEHTIPRWTRKYAIRKGHVTIRNKYIRCEKLYYGYHVELERYLCVQATPVH